MKDFHIANKIPKQFLEDKKNIDSKLDGITHFQIDKNLGTGLIKSIEFHNGLQVTEFELSLKRDISIPLSDNDKVIYFLYCFEGSSSYRVSAEGNMVKLKELQSAIIRVDKGSDAQLLVQRQKKFSLHLIQVETQEYFFNKEIPLLSIGVRLGVFFSDFEKKHSLVYLGKINLEISGLIKKLRNAQLSDPISESLYFEGICILILASHIEQYTTETCGEANSTSLIKRELKSVMMLADAIVQSPEKQYSLEKMSHKSGLSIAKLQEGFKFLYKRTVCDYIRNTRLERGERLLRETDMNISEVVYALGLTSRSYFCKIFKEKFNCSPKEYKSKNNLVISDLKLSLKD